MAAAAPPCSFAIKALPTHWPDEDQLSRVVEIFRAFRLTSLKTDPDSFSSTYESEVAFPPERWTQRLKNTKAQQYVAIKVADDTDRPTNHFEQADWLGLVTAIEAEDSGPSQFVAAINGLFVLPSARGNGLGRRLVEACLDFAKTRCEKQSSHSAMVRILADGENTTARRLYAMCGFKIDREEPYMHEGSPRKDVYMSQEFTFDE